MFSLLPELVSLQLAALRLVAFQFPLLEQHGLTPDGSIHELRRRQPFVGLADDLPQGLFVVGVNRDPLSGSGRRDVKLFAGTRRKRLAGLTDKDLIDRFSLTGVRCDDIPVGPMTEFLAHGPTVLKLNIPLRIEAPHFIDRPVIELVFPIRRLAVVRDADFVPLGQGGCPRVKHLKPLPLTERNLFARLHSYPFPPRESRSILMELQHIPCPIIHAFSPLRFVEG